MRRAITMFIYSQDTMMTGFAGPMRKEPMNVPGESRMELGEIWNKRIDGHQSGRPVMRGRLCAVLLFLYSAGETPVCFLKIRLKYRGLS